MWKKIGELCGMGKGCDVAEKGDAKQLGTFVGHTCNRTYMGDVGRTYDLEIRRPREDRLPFLCHLNFTAGGGDYGDLVQVSHAVGPRLQQCI
ncbi:Low-density lipoprotein receptor-related protein 2 [Gryllus bimaculatus]|nr:Low-density lipoprotein receptor-related protein 2 [Gryllus bimaculatus]